MKLHPIIQCFADDFDRFHSLLLKQVEMCPQELWVSKNSGHYFWQELAHSFYCVQIFALPEGAADDDFGLGKKAALLREDASGVMSKEAVLDKAEKMRDVARAFMEGLNPEELLEKQPVMSRALGKDCSHLTALIALVRHYTYHLGCCDSVLRGHGLAGVY